ncbi:metal-dependent hydrolase [Candidatus Poribacteria bacterium]|nr:metal-dependent hydrolase [Candidatus Poribacteria bacterium]
MTLNNGIQLTWLGHSTFKIGCEGQTVLIDPWVMNNQVCPKHLQTFDKIDTMLITHGHADHIGDAVELAKKHSPKVVAIVEVCSWLGSKGVKNTCPMNKGGTQTVNGLKVTMVHANHSNGLSGDGGTIIYGGEPAGYVIEFSNGYKIYHAGDTNVFGDMRIIGEIYQPNLALLPIGDHFTMGPREAAYASQLLNVPAIIPMHYGTFPVLTGTPEALRQLTKEQSVEIVELKPGETLS